MVGVKNTYNFDSITIQAGVIEVLFSVQNGKSINDFITITRDGFSCANDSSISTMNLSKVEILDENGYVIE